MSDADVMIKIQCGAERAAALAARPLAAREEALAEKLRGDYVPADIESAEASMTEEQREYLRQSTEAMTPGDWDAFAAVMSLPGPSAAEMELNAIDEREGRDDD